VIVETAEGCVTGTDGAVGVATKEAGRLGTQGSLLQRAGHWSAWFLSRLAVLVMIAYVVGPFVWMFLSSFQTRAQLFSRPPTWFPPSLYLGNYRAILHDATLIPALGNSAIVATFTAIAALTAGSLAAYAFARLRLPGKNWLFMLVLVTQMLPGIAILVPLYITMRSTGLIYTYQGLVIAYLSFNLPYVIWLLRAFFVTIPHEIEEAARLDGCSRIGAITRVILPLSAPGFVSTGIFAFVGAWNEFLIASVMTSNATKTFPVRMAQFIGEEATAYEHMFAAAVLGTIPVVLVAVFFQRYVISGLTEGAVKH
jgi:multiple sugar transport system permease protein